MKTAQNSSIRRSGRNVLPERSEPSARLFMGGIVVVIVAIDVLAIIYAK